jgi:bifunctional enzyme CysN/CysC
METQDLTIVIAGHVDHGKSTVMGRLLADTDSLPEGRLEQVRELCRRNSKPFEYAFLLDALKEERAQGITIDIARIHFKTSLRNYLILDAPGHIEFLKNMVTGAARAEAALLVIDAQEGVRENSRRHGTLLSLLGIRQLAVLVNKMDLLGFDQEGFERISTEYGRFLEQILLVAACFIPVSGSEGSNLARKSPSMPWYSGPTVLEQLDSFQGVQPPLEKPFRLPVQAVYKFTRDGDTRRIVAGTVAAGKLRTGDRVVFYPSGKKSEVDSLEAFNSPGLVEFQAGAAAGFTLKEQIFVTRGEVAARLGEPAPAVTTRLKVNLFWLGKSPLVMDKDYLLKCGTARVAARVETIVRILNAATLEAEEKSQVDRHEVAECILRLEQPIAFDPVEKIAETGRFVLVDSYEISGGGIILEPLEDAQSRVRDKVIRRNLKWEGSLIPAEAREARFRQKAALLLLTGEKDSGKKPIARELEKRLFEQGRHVYFMGISNVLYGVDADIKTTGGNNRAEHLRRLAEVAHLLLEAGAILIVTAVELTGADLEMLHAIVNPSQIEVFWIGSSPPMGLESAARIAAHQDPQEATAWIIRWLQEKGILF